MSGLGTIDLGFELGFGFGYPWLLLLLVLLPVHVVLRLRRERTERVPYPPLQFPKSGAGSGAGSSARLWLAAHLVAECLLLAGLVVALAAPYASDEVELLEDEGIDIALVLDVSLSMLAEDFPPDRLSALRDIADRFLERSGGHRVSIVAFAKDVYLQSPPTTDRFALRELMAGVSVDMLNQGMSGGTAIGDALLVAARTLDDVREEGRDQAIVLITDGASNEGIEPEKAARYVRHLDQRLYAIGIGGLEPVQVRYRGELVGGNDAPYLAVLEDAELQKVADTAGGRYYRAIDVDALAEIFGDLSRLESAPLQARTVEIRSPLVHHVAAVSVPLFAAVLWIGGRRRRPYR